MRTTALTLLSAALFSCFLAIIMSHNLPQQPEYTTNAQDLAEAQKLKDRLSAASNAQSNTFNRVNQVQIAQGRHKYVLISAREPESKDYTYFVTSKKGAHYHRNAAEPLVNALEKNGYVDIEITGGGRLILDHDKKYIEVFGFSYSFGQGNHEMSRQTILADERYRDYNVEISNEGY